MFYILRIKQQHSQPGHDSSCRTLAPPLFPNHCCCCCWCVSATTTSTIRSRVQRENSSRQTCLLHDLLRHIPSSNIHKHAAAAAAAAAAATAAAGSCCCCCCRTLLLCGTDPQPGCPASSTTGPGPGPSAAAAAAAVTVPAAAAAAGGGPAAGRFAVGWCGDCCCAAVG